MLPGENVQSGSGDTSRPAEAPPTITPAAVVAELLSQLRQPQPEALDTTAAAELYGISRSQFLKLHGKGLVPAPVELGERCPRWVRSELLAHLRAGAPSRSRWLMIKDARMRGVA